MKGVVFRKEFTTLPAHVNWFPGHMRKAMRQFEDEVKKADIFLEVRDARLPKTSSNTDLLLLLPSKTKRLILYNKWDLVPEKQTLEKIKELQNGQDKDIPFIHLSTKQNVNVNKLVTFIQRNTNPQFQTVGAWLMIGGIPNVGKSTIINSLRKRDAEVNKSKKSGAKTGGVPCITKQMLGFKIITDPATYVTDTPGIIQPKLNDPLDAVKLCACHSIRDGIVELELISDYVLFSLNKARQFAYVQRYNLPNKLPTDSIHDLLLAITQRQGLQTHRAAADNFLCDFREGKLGKVMLD